MNHLQNVSKSNYRVYAMQSHVDVIKMTKPETLNRYLQKNPGITINTYLLRNMYPMINSAYSIIKGK